MVKVGAHVSAAISLDLAFERASKIGAECFQIFVSPPQRWAETKHNSAEIAQFIAQQKATGIGPNFIHGTYLVNLGTESPEHLEKSIEWLKYAMAMAEKLGIAGVIFHTGSHKGLGFDKIVDQVVESIKKVLQETERQSETETKLILETSAGAGGNIGGTFRELGQILKLVQDDRLKICLDTQHVFAAGYDIKSPIGLKYVLEEFDKEIGLQNLVAIHANDSKVEYKSGRDRHANIGEGFIGKDGFEGLVNNPKLQNVPFILEVPGFADTRPDAENVNILKSLRKKL